MNILRTCPHPNPLPQNWGQRRISAGLKIGVRDEFPRNVARSPTCRRKFVSDPNFRGNSSLTPILRRQRGFSLLEVLVAFVILALVGTVLSRLYSSSLRNAGAAEEWSRAELVAESRLAAATSAVPLKQGSASGTDESGRINWSTRIEPYIAPDVSPDLLNASAQLPMQLLRVSVDVSFPGDTGHDRTIALSTVKLVRKDLQP